VEGAGRRLEWEGGNEIGAPFAHAMVVVNLTAHYFRKLSFCRQLHGAGLFDFAAGIGARDPRVFSWTTNRARRSQACADCVNLSARPTRSKARSGTRGHGSDAVKLAQTA
jgi:hypothetical protein